MQFRGPSVIPGYWNDAAATAEAIDPDGWLATGDLGYLDEDGYLFLVDRKKELIIRGGYNVYPREVEEALYAHPDVLEAAVIGVPHESLGEEVVAVVVLRPGAAASPEELQAWAKGRVAAYKYPRLIVFADELPKGPTGKILKRAIDRDTYFDACEAFAVARFGRPQGPRARRPEAPRIGQHDRRQLLLALAGRTAEAGALRTVGEGHPRDRRPIPDG